MKTKILLKNVLYQNPVNEERVLNEYAEKGWVLKKSNSFYSKLEKIDGENKKYSVQYISNLKRIGNKLSEQDELFIELCEADNWKFVSKTSDFLYFETDKNNEKKIRTDDEAYKKSVFKLLLIQEIAVFLIYFLGGLFAVSNSYKDGLLFVNSMHLMLALMGVGALLFSLPTLILTFIEKKVLGFPNEKIERIKVGLKKMETLCTVFVLFMPLVPSVLYKFGYEMLALVSVVVLVIIALILFIKSVKFKTLCILIVATLIILFTLENFVSEQTKAVYTDEVNCKAEQECFEIVNNVYKKYSGLNEVLKTPGFVDDKVHNYEGTRSEVSSLVSTFCTYSFKDKTTNEVFNVLYVSTVNDLLRDYYLEYLFGKIRYKSSSDSIKELLEKNDYVFESETTYFVAKDGVIIFVTNFIPEADKETTE